jgi:hypothetical protein
VNKRPAADAPIDQNPVPECRRSESSVLTLPASAVNPIRGK